MVTVEEARQLAHRVFELNSAWSTKAAKVLYDLADQLEYLEERDTISDSKLSLLREVNDTWKDAALEYQTMLETERENLAIERQNNEELRKQVKMLKEALYKT